MTKTASSRDIVILPCCKEKEGTTAFATPKKIGRGLSAASRKQLRRGKEHAFSLRSTSIDETFQPLPAIDLYTGYLYRSPGFKKTVRRLVKRGVHVLILSGGYGLVHACQPIRKYNARIQNTATIWDDILPLVLADYAKRNRIKRIFLAGSKSYASVFDGLEELLPDVRILRYVLAKEDAQGNPYQWIGEHIARAVSDLASKPRYTRRQARIWKRRAFEPRR